MKGPKQLPKKITEKLNKRETTKYEKLQEKWVKTGDDMIKTQGDSVQYGRKIDKIKEPTAAQKKKDQKLIDAAFKAFDKASRVEDDYVEFENKMRKKYT